MKLFDRYFVLLAVQSTWCLIFHFFFILFMYVLDGLVLKFIKRKDNFFSLCPSPLKTKIWNKLKRISIFIIPMSQNKKQNLLLLLFTLSMFIILYNFSFLYKIVWLHKWCSTRNVSISHTLREKNLAWRTPFSFFY